MPPAAFVIWADGRAWVVTSRADEYRRRAQRCLELAAAFGDREARVALSHMAEAWLRLAERDDFIAPVEAECAQPVIQQQQQVQPGSAPARSAWGWQITGSAMPSHKFHIGESVTLTPSISRNVSGGIYQVTKQLPHNGREFEYHIKSADEQHQRVARESDLTKM